MVNLLPSARTGVGGEERQITAVSFDRVRRGVALAQMADEVGDGFGNCGIGLLARGECHLAFALG